MSKERKYTAIEPPLKYNENGRLGLLIAMINDGEEFVVQYDEGVEYISGDAKVRMGFGESQ